ncbi:hypothetical protein MC885_008956 [Smutsia gigantea]|nr:hypothetical protein MC885_008956 [Smutsia gigantea]
MAMTLGYWDTHGLARTICPPLEYTDSNYESQWLKEKFILGLGLDIPNLPYLIDEAYKITQSNAILYYIAVKHNLREETEDKISVDILENEAWTPPISCPAFEKLKSECLEGLLQKTKPFSQFLGKRPCFAGDKIT